MGRSYGEAFDSYISEGKLFIVTRWVGGRERGVGGLGEAEIFCWCGLTAVGGTCRVGRTLLLGNSPDTWTLE